MKFTPKKQKIFINLIKTGESVTAAAEKCRISVRAAYKRRDSNAKFRRSWSEAVDFCVEAAERELRRRAVEGVDEPVFYRGAAAGTRKVYSDQLLLAYLKANRPEKYRERQEVRHQGELTTTMVVIADRNLPADVPAHEIEDGR